MPRSKATSRTGRTIPRVRHQRQRGPKASNDQVQRLRLIGMVHLPALPGSANARHSLSEIITQAVGEARLLARSGFDGVIVENFGDAPFAADCVPPETVACMAVVVEHVVRTAGVPVGVNVLRNDGLAALGVAAAAGAAFIRVNVLSGVYATDQGMITGRSRELTERRRCIAPGVAIAADVHVKHAAPISQPDIARAAEETAYRAGADVLIVSGSATGAETALEDVRRVRAAVRERPVWIGSGVTEETVRACLEAADGVIVGTALKRGGVTTAVPDPARVRAMGRLARK